MSAPLITFVTDSVGVTGSVARWKEELRSLLPEVHPVDMGRPIPPEQVALGQILLRREVAHTPEGSIHLGAVGPEARTLLVVGGVRAPGHCFLGPDNGLFSPFLRGGRVFAPTLPIPQAVAHLLGGGLPEALGPEVSDPVKHYPTRVGREGSALVGEILFVEPSGALVTNLSRAEFAEVAPEALRISIGGRTLNGLKSNIHQVEAGMPLALINDWGLLEIAVREASAHDYFSLHPSVGMPVVVEPV